MDWETLHNRLLTTERLWIKKLARNDRTWANSAETKDAEKALGHGFTKQGGVYIPAEVRTSDFFPPTQARNPAKPDVHDADIIIDWLAEGASTTSRLVHYSEKGAEGQLTRVPKEPFAELSPASLFLLGETGGKDNIRTYWATVLDSESREAALIETLFDLDASFHHHFFQPRKQLALPLDHSEQLIHELTAALAKGALDQFIATAAQLPASQHLAALAQAEYLDRSGLQTLNPFVIASPGDAVMEISRDIEYSLYKQAEMRHRAADVLRILLCAGKSLPEIAVRAYPQLGATFLSASQHRKSRAGRSFEHHIERLLRDGGLRYTAQAVTGGRRPDFVMPDIARLKKGSPQKALVLSAKTTIRERWKQVTLEQFDGGLFLATVDDRVSAESIADMARLGICLVVPESLKRSVETDYAGDNNVISFRQFFDREIRQSRPWLISGVAPDLFG
jgi:hypothetical protein